MSFSKVKDQMGREVTCPFPARRIVSLVPSQTEFLLDIGANIVGRTKFCIHPADQVQDIPIIGGTKQFRMQAIRELNPDLIIGNKEENYEEGITALSEHFPIWMSDIYTLGDAFQMMSSIGGLCDREEKAREVVETCKKATNAVRNSKQGKVIYLIWQNPWMAAGKQTFIDHMLAHLGFENLVTQVRYPELTTEEITELNPEKILLSSEPFPFQKRYIELVNAQWPEAEVHLVDGELYSWYGSRLKYWK